MVTITCGAQGLDGSLMYSDIIVIVGRCRSIFFFPRHFAKGSIYAKRCGSEIRAPTNDVYILAEHTRSMYVRIYVRLLISAGVISSERKHAPPNRPGRGIHDAV